MPSALKQIAFAHIQNQRKNIHVETSTVKQEFRDKVGHTVFSGNFERIKEMNIEETALRV